MRYLQFLRIPIDQNVVIFTHEYSEILYYHQNPDQLLYTHTDAAVCESAVCCLLLRSSHSSRNVSAWQVSLKTGVDEL